MRDVLGYIGAFGIIVGILSFIASAVMASRQIHPSYTGSEQELADARNSAGEGVAALPPDRYLSPSGLWWKNNGQIWGTRILIISGIIGLVGLML